MDISISSSYVSYLVTLTPWMFQTHPLGQVPGCNAALPWDSQIQHFSPRISPFQLISFWYSSADKLLFPFSLVLNRGSPQDIVEDGYGHGTCHDKGWASAKCILPCFAVSWLTWLISYWRQSGKTGAAGQIGRLVSHASLSSRLMRQNRSEMIIKSSSHFCSLKEMILAALTDRVHLQGRSEKVKFLT